ncbi:patatin-like phospholipase family protein [Legionella brunensis]|uniref:Patatin-like phospholipase n=1 Tax=Legionella brunensis TaxID=29422 RepID=A0A0W0SK67_9GAMM|nr:patatin-like phospholipase family protein [Legionella brunensis]KTC83786.1 patatin-like phospholipase [Legionella brunensis]
MQNQSITSDKCIINFLCKAEILKAFDPLVLTDLSKHLQIKKIDRGQILMQQGEVGDCLYFLMQGRLRVITNYQKENELIIGEIAPGETVGEMALLTQEPRFATVLAIRDSLLLRLDKASFEKFITQYPTFSFAVAKGCIKRLSLLATKGYSIKNKAVKTIAFLPLHHEPYVVKQCIQFVTSLKKFGSVLCVERNAIEKLLGLELPNDASLQQYELNILAWLNEQETHFDFIVYIADSYNSEWNQLCLSQADQLFLIGLKKYYCETTLPIKQLLCESNKYLHRVSIIFLYDVNDKPSNTKTWLDRIKFNDYYHVRLFDPSHIDRIARVIANQNIAIILSGGAARGLAHIGLIKALEELNIPIDLIGGTSMGAIIAASYAAGMNIPEMIKMAATFAKKNQRFDFNFPYVAFKKGAITKKFFQEMYGESAIEDSWLPSFYISTNLLQKKIVVHQQGPLWSAVLASTSLPVIFPPLVESNDFLIDGGVINNLPVDVVREVYDPGKIIASSIISQQDHFKGLQKPFPSFWKLLRLKLISRTHQRFSYIDEVIVSTILLNSSKHQRLMEKMADFCVYHEMENFAFMDFDLYEEIIERGYQSALSQLKSFKQETS